jgi:vibriolysin
MIKMIIVPSTIAICVVGALQVQAAEFTFDKNQSINAASGLGQHNKFIENKSITTAKGLKKQKLQQSFKGVSVYGQHLVLTQGTQSNVANGEFAQIADDFSVDASITSGQAIAALNKQYPGAAASGQKDVTLVVLMEDGQARLAYRVSFLSEQADVISRPAGLVDAHSGEVIRHWNELMTAKSGKGKPGGGTGGGSAVIILVVISVR